MREIFQLVKDIPKMIKSSNGLESIVGIIILSIATPIVLTIGILLCKLVQYLIY